jgi:hypothetical protein
VRACPPRLDDTDGTGRSVPGMTYSQPDPAEETTTPEEPQEPDDDVSAGRDESDDTEGGGQR